MGVSYLALPLTADLVDWLQQNDVSSPSPLPASRLPTLRELKSIAVHLDGYVTDVVPRPVCGSVDFRIEDVRGCYAGYSTAIWATRLQDKTPPPEDDDTVQLYFHKGSPELAVIIVEKLAHICGPLVLIEGVGGRPLLVEAGVEPSEAALRRWLD